MDALRNTYTDDDEDTEKSNNTNTTTTTTTTTNNNNTDQQIQPSITTATTALTQNNLLMHPVKEEQLEISDDHSEDEEASEDEDEDEEDEELQPQLEDEQQSPIPIINLVEEEDEIPSTKKQKTLSSITSDAPQTMPVVEIVSTPAVKKPKKKNNNVWTKPTSRKGKKKTKFNTHNHNVGNTASAANAAAAAAVTPSEDTVLITPIPRFPDRSDDSPDMKICLSKVYKAEKVELSDDRLSAGSCKGYRMVRATRGVVDGAWYFEIKVSNLGETGHTRLGWSMEKGDLQAPVGYDGNSFGYRDMDGSKVHRALREKYGEEGYVEGDVIGFYINLPDGELYAPKPPNFVWYKGQRYMCTADGKEESQKVVPGSEISFFKNGVCQGVAFKDLYGGRYYPAASMYTLPNQPNCMVKFNFGPDFECLPQDFNGRPIPRPMIEVPYLSFDAKIENGVSNEKGP